MRKELIHKLDYNERMWLYKAIARMVIVDKEVVMCETEDLRESLVGFSGSNNKDFKSVLKDPDFILPLKKLNNLKYEHAFIIVSEIARLASIDGKIVAAEENFMKELLELLCFKEEAAKSLTNWMINLAKVNKEEMVLKEKLVNYFHD